MEGSDPHTHFEPIQKTTLVESVMEQIVAQMRDGQLQPGSKLPSERALMQMMNVGRSTIREALQGLAALDLIETRSGEGSRVKETFPSLMEPDEVAATSGLQRELRLQLLEMREVVEVMVGTWAARRATDEDIMRVGSYLDDYIRYAMERDWPHSHHSHHGFHRALAEGSHNVIAVRVVDSLVATMPRTLTQKYVLSSEEYWRRERRIHSEIYERLRERDEDRLRSAIVEHMQEERRQIMAW